MPEELWTKVGNTVQQVVTKCIPKKKKCKKAKWLNEEALQIAVKRRDVKSKGEKERYKRLNAEFQRIARRDKKAFFSSQCKKKERKITEWERLEIPASRSFQMSQFFPSGGQSIGVLDLASVLPMNIRNCFPLGWTGLITLQSKGLSRVLQHHSSKASIVQCSAFFVV